LRRHHVLGIFDHESEGSPVAIGKKQICIVDDDESVCRALKLLLGTFGFEVITFPSAKEFFNSAQKSAMGCLVLDIHMPGMDGWHVLKQLIDSGSKCPVIIMTGDNTGWFEEDALKAGAFGFLHKPLNDRALVDLINRAL